MIEAYKNDRPMREAYLRINGRIHAEIWETEEGYQVALCRADKIGGPESPEFNTIDQCRIWASEYCPGLKLKE